MSNRAARLWSIVSNNIKRPTPEAIDAMNHARPNKVVMCNRCRQAHRRAEDMVNIIMSCLSMMDEVSRRDIRMNIQHRPLTDLGSFAVYYPGKTGWIHDIVFFDQTGMRHVARITILVLYREGAHWQIPCNNAYIKVDMSEDRAAMPWIKAVGNIMKLRIINTLRNVGIEGYTAVDECYLQYVKESRITTMLGKANLPRLVEGFERIQTFANTEANPIVPLTIEQITGLGGKPVKREDSSESDKITDSELVPEPPSKHRSVLRRKPKLGESSVQSSSAKLDNVSFHPNIEVMEIDDDVN
jgi:hypothetical protein